MGTRQVVVQDLGETEYGVVHALQQRLQAERHSEGGVDRLLLTEHKPVFTLGRSHSEPDLKVSGEFVRSQGIAIVQTERGGDITYHGPGQLVAYGIIDLKGWDLAVVDYVKGLEAVVIDVLGRWGVQGERDAHGRGVWCGGRKVASIGIHVRRWVTMHGVAVNVAPNMAHFDLINPCGMPDVEMTSLCREAGREVAMEEVRGAFVEAFAREFGCAVVRGESVIG